MQKHCQIKYDTGGLKDLFFNKDLWDTAKYSVVE